MKEAEMQAEATVDDGAGSPVPPIGFLEAWKRSWVWWTWDGRATRREYVYQWCIGLAGASVLYGVALAAMRGHFFPPWCSRLFVLYLLVKAPPWWGVTVRRFTMWGFRDGGFGWSRFPASAGWRWASGCCSIRGSGGPTSMGWTRGCLGGLGGG